MKNVLSKGCVTKSRRQFAATLLFYSNAAYNYVRQTFQNRLPHPRTIRKWFSTIDFNPETIVQILKSIKSVIDENKKSGKILQFEIRFGNR